MSEGHIQRSGRDRMAEQLTPQAGTWRRDWFAPLPQEEQRVFEHASAEMEICYSMMSVALDDAIGLRSEGKLVRARAQAGVAADLAERVSERVLKTLNGLAVQRTNVQWEKGRRPTVTPIDPDFFQHPDIRRIARRYSFLCRLLGNTRLRLFYKIKVLRATLRQVTSAFLQNARDIADGVCIQPGESWAELNQLHFDLNTCLRESIVLLKMVLWTLPIECLPALQSDLNGTAEEPGSGATLGVAASSRNPAIRAST